MSLLHALLLTTGIGMTGGQMGGGLTMDEMRLVRSAVYDSTATLFSPHENPEKRLLAVPKPLTTLYKQKPAHVLNVVLIIMDGANPRDSARAAGYAFELLFGPGQGVICVEFFEKATYDSVDKDWETTPRQHWIQILQSKIKATKKPAR